ncbi:MAG: alginate export family protein [Candidatus Omnitrophota bacterium]
MKRMLIMILALSMVAVLSLPAFAEVQNIKVSGEITIRGFVRDNYATTGSGGGADLTNGGALTPFLDTGSRDWYNTIAKLGVDADLTDNVSATLQMGNERDWSGNGAAGTNILMVASYITLKEMLYSPLTVKMGRMPVKVADGLVIGDGSRTGEAVLGTDYSMHKEFDGIVGILDYDPLFIGIGTAKALETASTAFDDVELYTIDTIYKLEDDMNTVIDTYLSISHYNSPGAGVGTGPTLTSTKALDQYVLATCITLQPKENLNLKVGLATQFGDYMKTAAATRDLEAYAYDLALDYAIENEYSPKVGVKWVYRSGQDTTKTTGDFEGWQAGFEDQTNGIIYDPNTNINAIALTGSLVPMDRLTVGAEFWMYKLAEEITAPAVGANTTGLQKDDDAGEELDLYAKYAYTEDVNLGLSLAWFFPGSYYGTIDSGANSGKKVDETATQIMAEIGVKF